MKLDLENTYNEKYLAMLPQWKCHKVVQAGKISFMAKDEPNGVLMIHAQPSNMPFSVPLDFLQRHSPEIGGYFVVYEDGYLSYSPADVFELGYRQLEPIGCSSGGTPVLEPKQALAVALGHAEKLAFDYAHALPEGDERDLALRVYHRIRLVFSNGKSGMGGHATNLIGAVGGPEVAPLETDMPPHQLRVLQEMADLADKHQKLIEFFDTEIYRSLDVDERGRLKEQSLVMGEYLRILGERVAAF